MTHIRKLLFSWLILALLAALLFGTEGKTTEFPSAMPESPGLSSAVMEELAKIIQSYLEDDQIVGAELLVIKNRYTDFTKLLTCGTMRTRSHGNAIQSAIFDP